MKKILGLILAVCISAGFTVCANAQSLSSVLPGYTTEEHIYLPENLPYELFDETLEKELGNLYICNENGEELNPADIISTGCRLMQKQDSGDKLLYTYVVLGDINKDGKVTAADARTALRLSAKLESKTEFTDYAAADVDASYTITAADARNILRYSAKLDDYEKFSSAKLRNMNPTDMKYILVLLKPESNSQISDLIDSDEVDKIIKTPNTNLDEYFIKLKNPGRDNADKLLYELNKCDDLIVNNPFSMDGNSAY